MEKGEDTRSHERFRTNGYHNTVKHPAKNIIIVIEALGYE